MARNFIESKSPPGKNPAKISEIVGVVELATTQDADSAVESAKKAFPAWSKTSAEDRAEVLFKLADIFRRERYT